ncbi:MAG: HEPN domain-containing protein [Deltaproteobacteria bacterium]|nr:HEPN domain-containing protein [Deltaproteobacteria bacterium]
MSDLDREILKKVRQWFAYAREDLSLARHGLTIAEGVPYRLIAYHAQQCAEKCFKAYLVYHRIDFPYTHNLSHLLELCGEETGWIESLMVAEELTAYATAARYPGPEDEVSRDEALRAIDAAALVMDTVGKALVDEGCDQITP